MRVNAHCQVQMRVGLNANAHDPRAKPPRNTAKSLHRRARAARHSFFQGASTSMRNTPSVLKNMDEQIGDHVAYKWMSSVSVSNPFYAPLGAHSTGEVRLRTNLDMLKRERM